jgi:hypothetical protein
MLFYTSSGGECASMMRAHYSAKCLFTFTQSLDAMSGPCVIALADIRDILRISFFAFAPPPLRRRRQ